MFSLLILTLLRFKPQIVCSLQIQSASAPTQAREHVVQICRQYGSKVVNEDGRRRRTGGGGSMEPRTQMAAIQENHAAATSCLFGSLQNTSPAPTTNKCALHPVRVCNSLARWHTCCASARFHNDKDKNMGKVYQACHESEAPRTTATSHTCIAHRSSTPVIPIPSQSHEDHISREAEMGESQEWSAREQAYVNNRRRRPGHLG